MEAPYTIATIPSPLDKEHGKVSAAPVYALKGSRKRKRHEVAIAVDGEGISIYNVQSQALVTTYAVPPQTYFCSKPCSLFLRATPDRPAQRRTYAAVRDGVSRFKRRVICFVKDLRSRKANDGEFAAPEKLECSIPDGSICALDGTASLDDLTHIVISYTDGRVLSASGDLTRVQETHGPFRASSLSEVEYATILDEHDARKGNLRCREDVLAFLDQTGTGRGHGNLLCQIVRSNTSRRLDLFLQSGHARAGLQTMKSSLKSIMSCDLPGLGKSAPRRAYHELHAATARLYSNEEGRLIIYDLEKTIPRILNTFGSRTSPIDSFARVSASLVVTTSAGHATAYEATYGSVQASSNLQIPATSSVSKRRKRNDGTSEESEPSVSAISVFSELGLFVFMSGLQLVATQLGDRIATQSRGKSKAVRLADVVGQGVTEEALKTGHEEVRIGMADWTAQINALVENNDTGGLETLIASDDCLGRQRKPKDFGEHKDGSGNDATYDEAAYSDLWPLPEPLNPTRLNRARVLYILSNVFSYAPDEPQVEVRIASRKLLEWLTLSGYLNRRSLERALRPADASVQKEPIRPGDIMTAISEVDEDFEIIRGLLSLPAQWEIAEVVQSLCLLIQSFDVNSEDVVDQLGRKLLRSSSTNNDHNGVDDDADMTNGDEDVKSHVESESRAAEFELEQAERTLMSGLEVRSDTLRVILERLYAFPARDVTQTMRSMMAQKELIFLIHMLRIELADGGWTSRYAGTGAEEERDDAGVDHILASMIDVIPSDGEKGPSNQAIRAIGDLLNCAVDAVGTSGWLVGLSGDALGTEELLDSLRAEVSAGLEGCYEANTLGTFLAELERFVASKPKRRRRDKVGEEVEEGEQVDPVLPVGGRVDPAAIGKSKRIFALEKSKQVGKYSLDRIRF